MKRLSSQGEGGGGGGLGSLSLSRSAFLLGCALVRPGGFYKAPSAAVSHPLGTQSVKTVFVSIRKVRCHRARLETRTKELHSAASGKGENIR